MATTIAHISNATHRPGETKRTSRRRRRNKLSLIEIIERALQNEIRARTMYQIASEKTEGSLASLFMRIAKEEEFQLDFFRDWYENAPGSEAWDAPRLQEDRERVRLAVQVEMAQLPNDNSIMLDYVLGQERQNRDFYLKQRQYARGKKLRAVLLDLADEENIHIDQLLEAAGLPPQPRLEMDELAD